MWLIFDRNLIYLVAICRLYCRLNEQKMLTLTHWASQTLRNRFIVFIVFAFGYYHSFTASTVRACQLDFKFFILSFYIFDFSVTKSLCFIYANTAHTAECLRNHTVKIYLTNHRVVDANHQNETFFQVQRRHFNRILMQFFSKTLITS